jgi:ParB family transcriptional regulator, chromosome partitioning protein
MMTGLVVETISISKLSFDPENARSHDKKNLDAIRSSLDSFGQRKPVVVTFGNVIVAGNGTVTAAQQLGWDEIDVVRIPKDWSTDQIKAFALADNRTAELANWNHEVLTKQLLELQESDFDVELIGFDLTEAPSDSEWEQAFDATASEQRDVQQITFTLHKDQVEVVKQALMVSKEMGEFVETNNANANGNALARICELWMGTNL